MVDEDNLAARLTHSQHLLHHAQRIRHHRHHVKGRHPIEAVVGKLEIERVALADIDMAPAVLAGLLDRVREHVAGRIDAHDLDVGRIGVERNAGAHADFEHLLPRPQIELLDCLVFVVDENSSEGVVVKTRQVGIDAALMRFAHR